MGVLVLIWLGIWLEEFPGVVLPNRLSIVVLQYLLEPFPSYNVKNLWNRWYNEIREEQDTKDGNTLKLPNEKLLAQLLTKLGSIEF